MSDITRFTPTNASNAHIQLAVLGDGYTESERGKFLDDVRKFLDYIFQPGNSLNTPFSNYAAHFDINAIFTASAQSGFDQPSKNIYVDTVFNAGQDRDVERMLHGNEDIVWQVIQPIYGKERPDITVVLVNTTLLNGAGGQVAWAGGGNAKSGEIVLHEVGHTFAGLQDEYADPAMPDWPLSLIANSAHVSASSTDVNWKHWLGYKDELGTVGIYEGGYYRTTGVWRATPVSKMYTMGTAFSAPEKEVLALRMYQEAGAYSSLSNPIAGIVSAVVPVAGNLAYGWRLNDTTLAGNTGPYLDLLGLNTKVGDKLSLTTVDATGMIRINLDWTSRTVSQTLRPDDMVVVIDSPDYTVATNHAVFRFGAGDDHIRIGAQQFGSYIDGGTGLDIVTVGEDSSAFKLTRLQSGAVLVERGGDAVFAMHDVERLEFSDATVLIPMTDMQPIDGGTGKDILLFSGMSSEYTFVTDSKTGRYVIIDKIANRDGSHSTAGIEFMQFKDYTQSLAALPGKVVSVTASTSTVDEGSTATFVIKAINMPKGSMLSYQLTGVSGDDVVGRALAGQVATDEGGAATVTVELAADRAAEGIENLVLSAAFKVSGTVVSQPVQIRDTSTPTAAPKPPATAGFPANDLITGGAGIDTVVYDAARSTFTITRNGANFTVQDNTAFYGTDTLVQIERLQFADQAVALDIDGNAGQIYRLYRAAFAREPDAPGLGFWIDAVDHGLKLIDAAAGYVKSNEFTNLYGPGASNSALLTRLYDNVFHRLPDQDGFDFWLHALDTGAVSVPGLLLNFSESAENRAALIGSISNGIAYTPFHA